MHPEKSGPETPIVFGVGGAGLPWACVRHPRVPGWVVNFTFDRDGGKVLAIDVRADIDGHRAKSVDPSPGADPFSARLLRRLPIGEMEDSARSAVVGITEGGVALLKERGVVGNTAHLEDAVERFKAKPRPGSAGRSDLEYAQFAVRYAGGVARGEKVPEIARSLNISASQLRNLVGQARKRGLLDQPPPGKSGGGLTPKARRLIIDGFDQQET